MEIIEKKILRGPNCWSDEYAKILICKINVNGSGSYTTQDIDELPGKLLKHGLTIVEEGPVDPAEKLIVFLTSLIGEIQNKTGLKKPYSFIAEDRESGEFTVGVSYEWEKIAQFSVESAIRIVEDMLNNKKPDVSSVLEKLNNLYNHVSLGATTAYIISEAEVMNIPWKRFGESSLIIFGYGMKQRKLRTAVLDTTSSVGLELAGDKDETKQFLKESLLPVPDGIILKDKHELGAAISQLGFPLVTKPLNGNHGRGVTTNINSYEEAEFGYELAEQIGLPVIVENYITGNDFRFLLIDYKLVAVAMRSPARITGDGKSTIEELIAQENKHPQRGQGPEDVLAPIIVDATTEKIFRSKNLTLASVLSKGEELVLKDTANISSGGTSTDVTHMVHSENIFMAERIARLFNLNICGIDIVAKEIGNPLSLNNNGKIIEVNAGPGLRMHSDPTHGTGRNVARPIIEMLFPGNSWRIPVVAVGPGKDSAGIAEMIEMIAFENGYHTGCASANGIIFQRHKIFQHDATDFQYAETVLFDPTINIAILECTAQNILQAGLPFNKCEISVIPAPQNASEENQFIPGILADVTDREGYCIINADYPELIRKAYSIKCRKIFYSMKDNLELPEKFSDSPKAIVKDGFINVLRSGTELVMYKIFIPEEKNYDINVLIPAVLASLFLRMRDKDIEKSIIK